MPQLTPRERTERLAELGVTVELFENAFTYAAAEARRDSLLDAPSMPGTTFWSRTNRYLAEQLIDPKITTPHWKHTRRDNILRVIHPAGSHAITAISGEGDVGVPEPKKRVRTKNPKGRVMAKLVQENKAHASPNEQLAIASRDELLFGAELDSMPTWILLYRRTEDGPIKAEVSLPVEMEGKYVDRWHERIPLFLPDIDPGINVSLLDNPGSDTPHVDVPVQRRREEG
ncbi:hypothetical protein SAMN06297387_12871 [Streptomyces zhaozhouensis]|uniref:Uncharacterized protein n=1 Tax=Streptomyces zhaozhouensis TaxID=1300267 RepID=A0A286E8D0_9ACTN|nr:hypothetical protein [Streptomyces zhaozhouensis]SOD67114.1 hypothetical protein SAMN06297387_12871 [Streptomyces zhaozhouensis]